MLVVASPFEGLADSDSQPALGARDLGLGFQKQIHVSSRLLSASFSDEVSGALPWRPGIGYGSRNAWPIVASIKHRVMGLTGDSMKPRER